MGYAGSTRCLAAAGDTGDGEEEAWDPSSEIKGMLPKEKVMLQSQSSAAGLTNHTTVAVFPLDRKTNYLVVVDTMVTKITPTYKRKYYDVQECCLSNNGALQTVEEISCHDTCSNFEDGGVTRLVDTSMRLKYLFSVVLYHK